MFNANLTQSNVNALADKMEFAHALLATTDPIVRAKGVTSYQRIAKRADEKLAGMSNDDLGMIAHEARLEVAHRRFIRREDALAKKKRREELAAMRAELEGND